MRNRKKNAVVLIFIIIVFTFFISKSLGIETYEPERHMELRTRSSKNNVFCGIF